MIPVFYLKESLEAIKRFHAIKISENYLTFASYFAILFFTNWSLAGKEILLLKLCTRS